MEGSGLNGKQAKGGKSQIGGGSTGGKQGMADALAEMTKRSDFIIKKSMSTDQVGR